MNNDTWPPPPSSPTPKRPLGQAVPRVERYCGIASLVLSIVGVILMLGMIVVIVQGRMRGYALPLLVGKTFLIGTILEAIGGMVGVSGRRTTAGKAGVGISFVCVVISIILISIGMSAKHG